MLRDVIGVSVALLVATPIAANLAAIPVQVWLQESLRGIAIFSAFLACGSAIRWFDARLGL